MGSAGRVFPLEEQVEILEVQIARRWAISEVWRFGKGPMSGIVESILESLFMILGISLYLDYYERDSTEVQKDHQ